MKISIPQYAYDFIFGILIGILNLIFFYIFSSKNNEFNITFYFIGAIILASFKNYQSALYSSAPLLIYQLLKFDIQPTTYFIISVTFIGVWVIETSKLFKSDIQVHLTTGYLIFISLLSLLLDGVAFGKNEFFVNESSTLTFIWTIFHLLIFYYIYNFSVSSNLLYQSANYAILNYYRISIASKVIKNFIRKNKIENGLFILMQVNYKKPVDSIQNEELLNSVLQDTLEKLPKKTIPFAVSSNLYGFFSPFVKIDKTISSEVLAKWKKNVYKKYKTSWNEIITIDFTIGASIYGIHDSSVDQLLKFAQFALNNCPKNKIKIYSSNNWIKTIQENYLLQKLDQNIVLDNYSNFYTQLWNLKNREIGIWASQENISEFTWKETMEEIIYFKRWQEIFTRYFANEATSKIKGKKLFLHYDINVFQSQNDVDRFLEHLNKKKFKIQNLHLVISHKSLELWNRKNIKWIHRLEKQGVNFVLSNQVSKSLYNLFLNIKYIYVENLHKINKYEAKVEVIAWDLKNEIDFYLALKKGATIVGGSLLSKDLNVANFNKQSKMYLKELLEKRND